MAGIMKFRLMEFPGKHRVSYLGLHHCLMLIQTISQCLSSLSPNFGKNGSEVRRVEDMEEVNGSDDRKGTVQERVVPS